MSGFRDLIFMREFNEIAVVRDIYSIGPRDNPHGHRKRIFYIWRQVIAVVVRQDEEPIGEGFPLPFNGPAMLDHQFDGQGCQIVQRAPILRDAPDALDVAPIPHRQGPR